MTNHPGPPGPLHHLVEGPLAEGPTDPPGRSPDPPGPSPGPPADPVPGTPDPDPPPPGPPVGERSPDEGVAPAAVHSPSIHEPTTHRPSTRNPTTHDPTTHDPTTHSPSTHRPGSGAPEGRVVLVHGFTQTLRSWEPVAARLAARWQVVRVDLPGHGGSGGVRVGFAEAARLLGEAGGVGVYVGYSMGGRLCLRLALDRPDLVGGLVLIGASPGIADPGDRAGRRADDEALAGRIEREGVAAFLERWLAGPLFATLPAEAAGRDERLANTPGGLASALRRLGTGVQEPLWDRLAAVAPPTLLVAGVLDAKFAAIAGEMAAAIGPAARVVLVPGAGHAVHLERPAEVAALVGEFLTATLGGRPADG
jgi:2-succinyl-6-hydroxy-2,4-cyclohexadiene-1-carboxylate synthase